MITINKNLKLIDIKLFSLILAGLLLLFISPSILILSIFIMLDHLNIRVKLGYGIDFPLDFVFIGMILLSYYFGFTISLIFIIHGFFARIMYAKFTKSHLTKQPIIILIAYLVSIFGRYDLVMLGTSFYVLRYLVEYILKFIMTGGIDFERLGIRIFNVVVASIIFLSVKNAISFFI
jgi:hypothetical protein